MELCNLPKELLYLIIEHLVEKIGIYKAVLLRPVSRKFNAAIMYAICISQVVDVHHPATPGLAARMPAHLRGQIFAAKSRSVDKDSKAHIRAVAMVNKELDLLIGRQDTEALCSRHELVAGAVNVPDTQFLPAVYDTRNVLCGAAIVGDLAAVRAILQRFAPHDLSEVINNQTPFFDPPLTLAAEYGHEDVAKELLLWGGRLELINVSWNGTGRTITQADWEQSVVDGSRASALRVRNAGALCAAVAGGHDNVVHLFLHEDYRFPLDSLAYLRAMEVAARNGQLELIFTLCRTIGKRIYDFNGLDSELLVAAAAGGHENVVRMLLDGGTDVDAVPDPSREWYHGALQLAASHGKIDMVQFLLKRGADANHKNSGYSRNRPIDGAAKCGHEEIVGLLIDFGADPARALVTAAEYGQSHLVGTLLRRLPDLPFRKWGQVGGLAISFAEMRKNLTSLSLLAKAGVPLEGPLFGGGSLLDGAKAKGREPWVIDHLVSIGAPTSRTEVSIDKSEACIVRDVRITKQTWDWVGKY